MNSMNSMNWWRIGGLGLASMLAAAQDAFAIGGTIQGTASVVQTSTTQEVGLAGTGTRVVIGANDCGPGQFEKLKKAAEEGAEVVIELQAGVVTSVERT